MTRDEVMALTDEELRIRAAELAGWSGPDGVRLGEWAFGRTAAWKDGRGPLSIPDYPRDIAAAWELFELIPMPCGIERRYEKEYGVGPVGTHVGFVVLPLDHDEDYVYAENVWALTAPLAITRAFVLAMSNETH